MRRLGHKPILAITAVVAAATAVTFAASPSARADIQTRSDSIELSSLPSSAPIVLDQFDPSLGPLVSITVTATLAGSVQSTVENLSSVASASTLSFTATDDNVGPASVILHLLAGAAASQTLTPNVATPYNLADTREQVLVITNPTVLALFSGTGTVTFDVSGIIHTTIAGPANWRTRGVARALATVKLDFDFGPPCGETTTSNPDGATTTTNPEVTTTNPSGSTTTTPPSCETTTTTTIPETTTTTTTTTPPTTTTTTPPTTTTTTTTPTTTTTTTTPTTTTTTPPTTTTTTTPPTTTTTTPPIECPYPTEWYPGPQGWSVGDKGFNDQLEITGLHYNGGGTLIAIDWASTTPISYLGAETIAGPPNAVYNYSPPATSGSNVRGNQVDGQDRRLKSLWACLPPTTTTTTTTTPPTTTTTTPPTTTTTTPPIECPYPTEWYPGPQGWSVGDKGFNDQLEITGLHYNGEGTLIAIDWASTTPISYLGAETIAGPPNAVYNYSPPATSGSNVRGNQVDGQDRRLKSLWACLPPTTTTTTTTTPPTTTTTTPPTTTMPPTTTTTTTTPSTTTTAVSTTTVSAPTTTVATGTTTTSPTTVAGSRLGEAPTTELEATEATMHSPPTESDAV